MGRRLVVEKRKRVPSWSKIKSNLTSSSATLTEGGLPYSSVEKEHHQEKNWETY